MNIETLQIMNISELLIIMNRLNYTKSKLVSLGYDKHLIEIEIMHSLKYYRIFGPENLKFIYKEKSLRNKSQRLYIFVL